MRLSIYERKNIIACTKDIFGEESKIYLFGSRVDDSKKGGDIDLYIEPENRDALYEKKIQFLIKLKSTIGFQKIDVVIAQDISRLIEIEAKTKGIQL